MVASRQALPVTRESITHKFAIASHEGYLTIGLYPEGRPGEIFIKMSKEGSTMNGMCQAFCRAFSLAIQHGLTVEDAIQARIGALTTAVLAAHPAKAAARRIK